MLRPAIDNIENLKFKTLKPHHRVQATSVIFGSFANRKNIRRRRRVRDASRNKWVWFDEAKEIDAPALISHLCINNSNLAVWNGCIEHAADAGSRDD